MRGSDDAGADNAQDLRHIDLCALEGICGRRRPNMFEHPGVTPGLIVFEIVFDKFDTWVKHLDLESADPRSARTLANQCALV